MKVYLLMMHERPVFYSEGLEEGERLAASRRGARGWLERKLRAMRVALEQSESGMGRTLRRLRDWLHLQISPDETLLRGLRSSKLIAVYHPTTMTAEESVAAWREYLGTRQRYHGFWFALNAVLSPLGVLLTPIPGPNVVAYWFVYRAICHFLAIMGISRGRRGRIPTVFHPSDTLDRPFEDPTDDWWIDHLAVRHSLKGLGDFLKRIGDKRVRTERPDQRNTPEGAPHAKMS